MLTGWELEYLCSDKHVKDIGVWIDSWSYQPPANGTLGVLTYKISSILVDNDSTHTQFQLQGHRSRIGRRLERRRRHHHYQGQAD